MHELFGIDVLAITNLQCIGMICFEGISPTNPVYLSSVFSKSPNYRMCKTRAKKYVDLLIVIQSLSYWQLNSSRLGFEFYFINGIMYNL